MQKVDRKRKAFSIGHTSQCYLYHCSSGESPAKCSVRRRIFVLLFQLCWIEIVFTHHQGNPVAMGKRSKIPPPPDWESCEGIAPFKLAEKRYKRYCGKKTDFSDVFDPWEAATSDSAGAAHTSSTSSSRDLKQAAARRDVVVPVPEHDGIFILPGWLSKSEQLSLAHQCLAVYPEPPNKTNLLPHMGQVSGIWEGGGKALNDLRWATLGFQYDWTARTYPEDQRGVVPSEIQAIAEGAVAATRCAARAIQAEAVIVNFYHPTTTLGGHCDDVEPDQTTPIVSVSLGCAAVFLAGGEDKQEAPTAVWLRGGDVMVMSGEGRRCMHGVPRILSSEEASCCPPRAFSSLRAPAERGDESSSEEDRGAVRVREIAPPDAETSARVSEYLQNHRINLNIRQVFPPKHGSSDPVQACRE